MPPTWTQFLIVTCLAVVGGPSMFGVLLWTGAVERWFKPIVQREISEWWKNTETQAKLTEIFTKALSQSINDRDGVVARELRDLREELREGQQREHEEHSAEEEILARIERRRRFFDDDDRDREYEVRRRDNGSRYFDDRDHQQDSFGGRRSRGEGGRRADHEERRPRQSNAGARGNNRNRSR